MSELSSNLVSGASPTKTSPMKSLMGRFMLESLAMSCIPGILTL